MNEIIFTSVAIGFFGSLHCVGMCGGLVTALCMTRPKIWWPGLSSYQLGRISTYTLLGLLVGSASLLTSSNNWFNQAQLILSIIAGGLMILFAFYIGGFIPDPFARLTRRISLASGFSHWVNKAATENNIIFWYIAGLLNGLLPCGLVYAGLALSINTSSTLYGGLTMLAFGLGTIPAMTMVPGILRRFTPDMRARFMKIAAILLILLGVLTMFRGTLHGSHEHAAHEENGAIHQQNNVNKNDHMHHHE